MLRHDTDRTKVGDRDYRVECLQCGTVFEASRSDATFCSARCRVAYSREPQKLEATIEKMNQLMRALDRDAVKYRKSHRVFAAMRDLRDSLSASLERFEAD